MRILRGRRHDLMQQTKRKWRLAAVRTLLVLQLCTASVSGLL